MSQDINNPHDSYFIRNYQQKDMAVNFLAHRLDKKMTQVMVLSDLEPMNKHFVDANLRQSYSDLLYKIPLKSGVKSYVYVLF